MMVAQFHNNAIAVTLHDGTELLFHHDTPVAGYRPEHGYFKSQTRHSRTTSRVVGKYFEDRGADPKKEVTTLPQPEIESLVDRL
jgi:hypothetical protein